MNRLLQLDTWRSTAPRIPFGAGRQSAQRHGGHSTHRGNDAGGPTHQWSRRSGLRRPTQPAIGGPHRGGCPLAQGLRDRRLGRREHQPRGRQDTRHRQRSEILHRQGLWESKNNCWLPTLDDPARCETKSCSHSRRLHHAQPCRPRQTTSPSRIVSTCTDTFFATLTIQ